MGRSMTQFEVYNALFSGGKVALPFLIAMSHPDSGTLYFVNNTDDITYEGRVYKAASFRFTPPKTVGGVQQNGNLQISAIDNNALNLIDASDERFQVTIIGAVAKDGTVTAYQSFIQKYCTVNITENMDISISFDGDDRMGMVFPPVVFDTDNNRGNA